MSERPVLLALRPLGLRDFLTAVPAYRALARTFPEHLRILAVPAALAPLVPLTHAFHGTIPAGMLRGLEAARASVDVAVNLHGRGPSSHRLLLGLRPRHLLAFAHPDVPESRAGTRWNPHEHDSERWCRMLDAYGIESDPDEIDLGLPPLPDLVRGYTLIHPGATSASQRWPAERWAAVARRERSSQRRVIVTGGRREWALARDVAQRAELPLCSVRAGAPSSLELASLVRGAGLVLCGDTGVAHLAGALRRPSVVLFGPTAPRLCPPVERAWQHVLWAGWDDAASDERRERGLLEIAVEDVLSEIVALRSSVLELALRSDPERFVAHGAP
jgi:ADP-heptose:LPS heptosyltransferase